MQNRIAVLIVTFNRLDKLKKALSAYDEQIYKPYEICVVDNNSTDGTREYLTNWVSNNSSYRRCVINLEKNIGGSGGFYEGIKAIMIRDFDWLWIADDDAYPEKDALAQMNECINSLPNDQIRAICSSVETSDGLDLAHRKIKGNYVLGVSAPMELYSKKEFEISVFSFVGSCVERRALIECGLPMKDFFIWFDDTEYSLRVNEKFKIICVPGIRVFHDTIIEKEWRYSWKTYFGERNKLYTLQIHMPDAEFKRYLLRYRLGMVKHFFTDHKYYLSQRDGYNDFQKGITGLTEDHGPGKYKY